MQTTRITVSLPIDEREGLRILAQQDLRDPREHMRFLLRRALQERGLLTDNLHHIPTTHADDGEANYAAGTR